MKIIIYELMGLIKDNKAPKRIKYNGDIYIFCGDDYSKNDDRETWLITKYDYFLSTFLNETVEVLSKENDEWEDIEELAMLYNENSKDEIMRNRFIINKLIKNQRKIIEILKKDE